MPNNLLEQYSKTLTDLKSRHSQVSEEMVHKNVVFRFDTTKLMHEGDFNLWALSTKEFKMKDALHNSIEILKNVEYRLALKELSSAIIDKVYQLTSSDRFFEQVLFKGDDNETLSLLIIKDKRNLRYEINCVYNDLDLSNLPFELYHLNGVTNYLIQEVNDALNYTYDGIKDSVTIVVRNLKATAETITNNEADKLLLFNNNVETPYSYGFIELIDNMKEEDVDKYVDDLVKHLMNNKTYEGNNLKHKVVELPLVSGNNDVDFSTHHITLNNNDHVTIIEL